MDTVQQWTGRETRALRQALRMSMRGFADHLGVALRTVAKWEQRADQIEPRPPIQEALDAALRLAPADAQRRFAEIIKTHSGPRTDLVAGSTNSEREVTPDDTVAAAGALWAQDLLGELERSSGDVALHEVLASVAHWLVTPTKAKDRERRGVIHVGLGDVELVRAAVRTFERLDHDFGGGYVRRAAVQYLHTAVVPLLSGTYTAKVGRELFASATEATYKTGAMAYDVGEHDIARRYFLQALNFAQESGDRALGGKVLALMSHQANFLGQFTDAVDLARAAKLGGHQHATARVRAMYSAMEARALASLNNHPDCLRSLRDMEEAFTQAGDPRDDPAWIRYFETAELHNEIAHCLAALGEPALAKEYTQIALAESGANYPRSQTFCRLAVATSLLKTDRSDQRSVEEACALAESGLHHALRLKSQRIKTYLNDFTVALDNFGDTDAVRSFQHRMAEAQ